MCVCVTDFQCYGVGLGDTVVVLAVSWWWEWYYVPTQGSNDLTIVDVAITAVVAAARHAVFIVFVVIT